jgi:hypothetical protein
MHHTALGLFAAFLVHAAGSVEARPRVTLVAQTRSTAGTADIADDPLERLVLWTDTLTVAAVRVDVARADVRPLLDLLARGAKRLGARGEAFGAELQKGKTAAETFRAAAAAAGATEVFFVFTLRSPADGPGYFVVPVGAGADRAKLKGLLGEIGRELSFGKGEVIERPAALLFGNEALVAGFPLDEPRRDAHAEELRAALLASTAEGKGVAPFAAAFAPPAFARRAFEENPSPLPPDLGNVSTKVIAEGVRWAAVGVDPAAGEKGQWVRVVAQSRDAEAAKAFADAWGKVLERAVRAPNDPEGERVPAELIPAFTPVVAGDRVELVYGQERMERLVDVLVPATIRARDAAQRIVQMSNLRQVLVGCTVFAADNKGAWPESLDVLKAKGYFGDGNQGPDPILTLNGKPWAYLPPSPEVLKQRPANEIVVVHEPFEVWPEGGLLVGRADGAVVLIVTRAEFEALLSKAK